MGGLKVLISFLIGAIVLNGGIRTPVGRAFSPDDLTALTEEVISAQAYSAVSQEVRTQLEMLEEHEMLTVILTMKSSAELATPSLDPQKNNNPIRKMQALAKRSQTGVLKYLGDKKLRGLVKDITPLWIFNGVAVTASPQVIEELGNRSDVVKIEPNRIFYAPSTPIDQASGTVNIEAIGATALWEMGFRGEGIVVANMDTGVYGAHPDLANSWRGGENSWYDTTGQYPDHPFDTDGHGTWTMGVMVGGDSSGRYLGVAPDAQWIAVRIFDDDGLATSVRIHLGFQWLLDPDGDPDTNDSPHVVNSSWAFQSTGCFLDFQSDIQALRDAGILPIFAAGNSGPGTSTGLSPANNPGAFSVGAVDQNGLISSSSSRGPSSCGLEEQVFPSIVTPGIGIQTTTLRDGYTFSSGTSMAAPHVAGALALLLNAYRDLDIDDQERVLLESAQDLGEPGPDYIYGHGRLDIQNAYRILAGQPIPPAQPADPTGQGNGSLIYLPILNRFNGER